MPFASSVKIVRVDDFIHKSMNRLTQILGWRGQK